MGKKEIESALKGFKDKDFSQAAMSLLECLGYQSPRRKPLEEKTYNEFNSLFVEEDSGFRPDKALVEEWKCVDFLFQITDEELNLGLDGTNSTIEKKAASYLFFCLELVNSEYSRTVLSQITREINKNFSIPALILFKTGDNLTFSIINRRHHKRDEYLDVLEKVTLIKDINIADTHRAHIDVLFDLSLSQLRTKNRISNFSDLHNAWQSVLDTKELNKKFYKELSEWYYWAMGMVFFPSKKHVHVMELTRGQWREHPEVRENNATHLIRLLTRILFVWFIKEKGLVSEEFFKESALENLLKDFDKDGSESTYYKAVLQNIFFATLNQEINYRKFRTKGYKGRSIANLWRYEDYFKDKDRFEELTKSIPFLNGGLFECLDKFEYKIVDGREIEDKENSERIDWFSEEKGNKLEVPNEIFFIENAVADISAELGAKAKKVTVRGLFHILRSYKFTVAENTPIEVDLALDPELLGNVFENLLASYNPETKTTARKQTGSYYTPKEIVNYMVDESLKYYLRQALTTKTNMSEKDINEGLGVLFAYTEKDHCFPDAEKEVLIEAIEKCKILDPACGSGAFPMGILQKLVYILGKLDPNNRIWMERQKRELDTISDPIQSERAIADIEEAFENNELDYSRKLYLIKNCIYGVDIQSIATQISKLRFLISLMIEQKIDFTKPEQNFNIRALPNLETKFVAANTLIELPKQNDQISLFDIPAINSLQEQMESIRNRMFSARTIKTKRKHRQNYKTLREKLKQELIKGGENQEAAEMLAKWDPYDQNMSSPFFDSAWMFGIDNGFDIVIGNPPYIDSENMVNSGMIELRDSIKESYQFAKGNWDIYIAFFELGFNVLSNSGNLCYITPDKWISKSFGNAMRTNVINNIVSILAAGRNVFESALVDSIVTLISKKETDKIHVYEMESKKSPILYKRSVNKSILSAPFALDIIFSEYIDLINKLQANKVIADFYECENACATADCYELKELLYSLESFDEFDEKKHMKIINTGTIGRYVSRWGNKPMKYLKDSYQFPVVKKNEFHKHFPKSYGSKSIKPKIIIKGLTLLDSCIDFEGQIIPGKSTMMISAPIDELLYLSAIINSKLMIFFIKQKYSSSSYNGGINFTKDMINNLPFKKDQNGLIFESANSIFTLLQNDHTADTTMLDIEINNLVYELYGLSVEEIKAVEESIK